MELKLFIVTSAISFFITCTSALHHEPNIGPVSIAAPDAFWSKYYSIDDLQSSEGGMAIEAEAEKVPAARKNEERAEEENSSKTEEKSMPVLWEEREVPSEAEKPMPSVVESDSDIDLINYLNDLRNEQVETPPPTYLPPPTSDFSSDSEESESPLRIDLRPHTMPPVKVPNVTYPPPPTSYPNNSFSSPSPSQQHPPENNSNIEEQSTAISTAITTPNAPQDNYMTTAHVDTSADVETTENIYATTKKPKDGWNSDSDSPFSRFTDYIKDFTDSWAYKIKNFFTH